MIRNLGIEGKSEKALGTTNNQRSDRQYMKTTVKISSTFDHGNTDVLDTLLKIKELDPNYDEVVFDLSYHNDCNPFNNLLIAKTLANFKRNNPSTKKSILPCKNTNTDSYLQHIGFYKFFGVEHGKDVGVAQASYHYVPITPIEFDIFFYEGIEKYGEKLAKLLSFDRNLYEFSKYIFIEIIRNIYEHSGSNEAYMCAQTWDRYNLTEIAILDSGCGISNALCHIYKDSSEEELLRMATSPGISARSNFRYTDKNDGWRNSGYGLYVLKRLALEYGGSLMICSNNYCDYYHRNGTISHYKTFYPGTALAIRFKTDQNINFAETRRRIVAEGEKESSDIHGAIKSASKSSGGHYHK